ncbi:hypothetical protein [Tenuifilum thalassicum]|uniref:Uncharacterized protein n=1 Tax=Tenuifilum thalassicum TaxID=2590900 RepID=A0A7D4CQ46_9BACT|nr:hypothetical protein [Tenuifilum thalassicum]QKG79185.1 hypothetical protein FHG85_02540 [Tenuifilum thalassicum]
MRKKILNAFVIIVIVAISVINISNSYSNVAPQVLEKKTREADCYWTYQTGWFASWHIMACFSCKPVEVKEFRNSSICSL